MQVANNIQGLGRPRLHVDGHSRAVDSPVLIVGNFLTATRGNRGVCEDLASRLVAGGWAVLTASDKPGRVRRLLDMISTVWRRRHEYAVAQVDVFSGPAFFWAEAVCWMLRRVGKPYVLTLHGGGLPVFAHRWPDRVRRLLRSASAVTTPSRYLLEQMASYRADLHLQPNALDLPSYRFRVRTRPQPALVWLRAFHETYNPCLAPRVVKLLVREFPDVRLCMIGPDKQDGSLQRTRQLATELGVMERLTLPGAVPRAAVPRWLDQGDVFVNTSYVDNMPISVLEAMACGLCIVSTNVGGIPYLVEHEHDGLLLPSDDPEAMAAAVRRILTEPELASYLSGNARRKTEQWDWSVILPEWEALLRAVITRSADVHSG